jgi:hypothetical protein
VWGAHHAARRGGRKGYLGGRARALLAVLTCGLTLVTVHPASAQAANPIGAHSMLQLNSPYSFMQTMFAEAAAMHASAIRLDVAPALIFPSQTGQPDFSGLDEVMALSRQYHLRVLADLFTIPPWLAGCNAPSAMEQSRCAPADEAEYGSIVSQIVTHADPVIRDWEIWNEPDSPQFFTGSPQQYAMMLRTAHDAIKAVDPSANVLLGGISSSSGMGWLAQVLATPGADAVHAFDIANVHERGWLDDLVGDLVGWRWFLAAHGFTGPVWVTEHGYPSDPAYQFDPHFRAGLASQAAYLEASIPSLIDAGAAEVFVTERDNLGGEFASEGLLGGDVTDPPVADPQVVERPAFSAVAHLADCYAMLGRDCPGGAPAVGPSSVSVPPVRLGRTGHASVTVSDPGPGPLMLAPRSITGAGLSIAHDTCPVVLEPDETCTISIAFFPTGGGGALGLLLIPSDGGTASIPVSAVATSVSSLISAQPPVPRFSYARAGNGVGIPQKLVLRLTNPLSAPVRTGIARLSGPDAARFALLRNTCRGLELAPHRSCQITVSFTPAHLGAAGAMLTLTGDGAPLTVPLEGMANRPPAIRLLAPAPARASCGLTSAESFRVRTSQPSVLMWRATRARQGPTPACLPVAATQLRTDRRAGAGGRTATSTKPVGRRGRRGYPATVRLGSGLRPGVYRLRITPANAHGLGAARVIWVAITG